MLTTLAERLKDVMRGPPRVTNLALAKACGVTSPSVSGWRTGDSKSLEGSNLLAAAEFLGVRPKWLADGIGPKYAVAVPAINQVEEIRADYQVKRWPWPFMNVTYDQYVLLDDEQRVDVEKYILLHVKTREPPEKHETPAQRPRKVQSA